MTTTTQTRPPNIDTIDKQETFSLIASDKVEGTAVFDRDGEKIGTVRKVMIGKRDGQVRYVVMGMGGLFGSARIISRCRGTGSTMTPSSTATSCAE